MCIYYRFGTDSGDHFKVEERSKNNEVKGVYSWLDPSGNAHTVAYNSGIGGYRTLPLASASIDLPKFPYSLYNDNVQSRTNGEPQLYTPGGRRGAVQSRPAPLPAKPPHKGKK